MLHVDSCQIELVHAGNQHLRAEAGELSSRTAWAAQRDPISEEKQNALQKKINPKSKAWGHSSRTELYHSRDRGLHLQLPESRTTPNSRHGWGWSLGPCFYKLQP